MKKIFILHLIMLLAGSACVHAQEKFTGIIEYELKDFETITSDDTPLGMTTIHSKEKILLKLHFKDKMMEQRLLINTLNDSLYRITPNGKVFTKESLQEGDEKYPMLVKTDSTKTFLGYACRGYRLTGMENETEGYIWLAEQLMGLDKEYPNKSAAIFCGRNVMLGGDIFEEGKHVASFMPTSVKMEDIPGSMFDLTGYSEVGPPFLKGDDEVMADTAVPAPADYNEVKKPVKKKPAPKKPAAKPKAKPAAKKPKQ